MKSAIINFVKEILNKTLKIIRSVFVYLIVFILISTLLTALGGALIGYGGTLTTPYKETVLVDQGGEDKIVIRELNGIILSQNTPTLLSSASEAITPRMVQDTFRAVKMDPLVKAVIFDLNYPGGSPVASDRIFEMIQDFRQETNIPVIFLMGDLAASGGYYIASAGNFIVANPSTITGSIGVVLESFNLEELYDKIGVKKQTFKKGEYKDILNEGREITEEEAKILDSLNENVYEQFIDRVAQGRNLPLEQVKSLANGQVYSGKQAKDLQLVDSLGNLDEAIYQAKSLANIQRYKVIEYSTTSFMDSLFGQVKQTLSPWVWLTSWLQKMQSSFIHYQGQISS